MKKIVLCFLLVPILFGCSTAPVSLSTLEEPNYLEKNSLGVKKNSAATNKNTYSITQEEQYCIGLKERISPIARGLGRNKYMGQGYVESTDQVNYNNHNCAAILKY